MLGKSDANNVTLVLEITHGELTFLSEIAEACASRGGKRLSPEELICCMLHAVRALAPDFTAAADAAEVKRRICAALQAAAGLSNTLD